MHPNRAFQSDDREALLAEAAELGLARLFLTTPEGPRVAHAPVLREGDRLRFHLVRGNALCGAIEGARVLALFEGPHGYISANWYGDPAGAVPTWNYVAIECEGPVRTLDRAALIDLLDGLSARFEPSVGEDWTRTKMEPARFDAMLNTITAFELTVETVRATHKLGQNKSADDRARVVAALAASGGTLLADRMAKA